MTLLMVSFLTRCSGPSKRNLPTSIFSEGSNGVFRIEFIPTEVGSHLIDVSVAGDKLIGGPLVAKVYNTSYIHVTDVKNGVVGQPCQFKGTLNSRLFVFSPTIEPNFKVKVDVLWAYKRMHFMQMYAYSGVLRRLFGVFGNGRRGLLYIKNTFTLLNGIE